MDIPITNKNVLIQATKAHNNFKDRQIPFAAVKLDVWLQNISKKEIDTFVENNFRSEKDSIFKKNTNYLILMKRTTFEEAQRAVFRLKTELGCIAKKYDNLKNKKHYRASASIFGTTKGTKRMQVKHLNLIPDSDSFDRNILKMSFGYDEYIKCCELPGAEILETNKIIKLAI